MASYIEINNLGSYANIGALWAAYPEGGQEGDYCTINSVKYHWDKYDRMWVADPNFGPTPARNVDTFYGDVNMQNNLTVAGYIRAKGIKQPCLGLFLTEAALKAKWPEPEVGMWALVGENFPATVYVCETDGEWTETEITAGPDDVDLTSIVINGIKGWVAIDSISDLPSDPTEDEKSKGYLLDTTLYTWDEIEETFKSAELKGADGQDGQDGAPGAQGPEGPAGLNGVDLGSEYNLVNDLTTGGATNVLSAEMGKVLQDEIDEITRNKYVRLSAIKSTVFDAWSSDGGDIIYDRTFQEIGLIKAVRSIYAMNGFAISGSFVKDEVWNVYFVAPSTFTSASAWTLSGSSGSSYATPNPTVTTTTSAFAEGYVLVKVSVKINATSADRIRVRSNLSAAVTHNFYGVVASKNSIGYTYDSLKADFDAMVTTNIGSIFRVDDERNIPVSYQFHSLTRQATNLTADTVTKLFPIDVIGPQYTTDNTFMDICFTLDSQTDNLLLAFIAQDGDGAFQTNGNAYDSQNHTFPCDDLAICKLTDECNAYIIHYASLAAETYHVRLTLPTFYASMRIFNVTVCEHDMIAVNSDINEIVRNYNKTYINKDFDLSWCFRKLTIATYGCSIDAEGGFFEALANYTGNTLRNFAQSGGIAIWPSNPLNLNSYIHVKRGWSCTLAEKEAKLTALGIDPTTVPSTEMNAAYDVSVLQNTDADVFIIGAYGYNDQQYSDAYVISDAREYDRETLYGAENYVLQKLFQAKPTAKVVLLGIQTRSYSNSKNIDAVQKAVAEKWGLPLLYWSYELGFNSENYNSTTGYSTDNVHLGNAGKARAAKVILYEMTKLKGYLLDG